MAVEQDFTRGLKKVNARIMKALEKGVGRAGMLLLTDASTVAPRVPHDEGTLRGSGSVFLQNRFIFANPPEGKAKPATDHKETIPRGQIVAVVGFNTPYAARLHENPQFNFREAGTGGKWLELKMSQNAKLYMREIERTLDAERRKSG